MFAKNKVTQSMLDAVNSVLVEDEKKRLINDADIDETGFHKAAHAAKKSGQSHFEFQGKKYPVTAKSHKEAIEMDEANSEKVKTATGMVVYGHRYGNAAKARKDQTKSSVDDIHKGPSKSDIEKTGKDDDLEYKRTTPSMKKQYATHAGKYFSAMDKGDHRKTDKEAPRYKNEEYTFATKLLNHITENKAAHPQEVFTDNNLGEEEMTDKQKAKREKIVLSMKKGEPGFKQRYGKNYKNVMYATATKQAMKEDASDTWNGSYDFLVSEEVIDLPIDPQTGELMDDYEVLVSGDTTELKKNQRMMLEEGDASYKKMDPKKPFKKMSDVVDRKKTVKSLMKGRQYFGTGKKETNEAVDTETDKSSHKVTTDTLAGRVAGGKLNSFKNFKVNLTVAGEEDIPKEMDKGEDTKEKQKITTNPGPVDIKLDDKYGSPTPQSHFSTQEKITKEEVELTEGALEQFLSQKGIEMKNLSYNSKIAYSKSNEFIKWKQNHQMESSELPFDKPYKTVKDPVTTDKSGAKHTPHSRAKDLAKNALKKLKGETMMGKISN